VENKSILTVLVAVFVVITAGSVGLISEIDSDEYDKRDWTVVPPGDYNDPL
jgi:hypothetical protein